MAIGLYNRVGVSCTSLGTGPATLGFPIPANTAILQPKWQSFISAGVTDGSVVRYLIFSGDDWEYGHGTYNAGVLTRAPDVSGSTSGAKSSTGTPISLNGNSQVFITAVAEDLEPITVVPGPNSVTDAMLVDMTAPSFKGRITAGTGDPQNLTSTQATSMLDLFTSTLKGLTPLSGGGIANFLRADGSWAVPPGTGGGSGTPGGANHSIQYNAAGAFGGILLGTNEILVGQTGADPIPMSPPQVVVILNLSGAAHRLYGGI